MASAEPKPNRRRAPEIKPPNKRRTPEIKPPNKRNAPELKPPNKRRALSHVGGEIRIQGGSREEREALEYSLRVKSEDDASMVHVHGFHSYPARLHPDTAGRLIDAFSSSSETVLDPFCGSGTVLVESMIRGRKSLGIDLNPVAIELSWLKTHTARSKFMAELEAQAEGVVEHANGRRLTKAGPTERYGQEDRSLFAPHVLLELDGLRDGIRKLDRPESRRALLLVLSAILTKVSLRAGDASGRMMPKRLASGHVLRLFARKTTDLVKRVAAFEKCLPERAFTPRVEQGDARRLPHVKPKSVDLVLSSPPYAGVYDYLEHHRLRLRWLDLPEKILAQNEIGSRRQGESAPNSAFTRFERDFRDVLSEVARSLAPKGRAILIVADSVLGGHPLYADELVGALAPKVGLSIRAIAAQERPDFHLPTRGAFKQRPRSEHVIVLEPGYTPARR